MHAVAPAADHDPAAHGAQLTSAVGENEPAPHGEHVTAPPTPITATDPAEQMEHAATELEPAGDVWPAPHEMHNEPAALE